MSNYEQPKKKSSGLKIVIIIIVCVGLVGVICIGGITALSMFGLSKAGEVIQVELNQNTVVQEHVGTISDMEIQLINGQQPTPNDPGDIMTYDVKGDKGDARVVIFVGPGGKIVDGTLEKDGEIHDLIE